jgi:DNA polymerase-3 subunit gamma/tau
MVLVRLCHAADLPTPDEALKALSTAGPVAQGPAPTLPRANPVPALAPAAQPAPVLPRPSAGQPFRAGATAPAQAAVPAPAQSAAPPAPAPAPELRRFEDVLARARAEREVVLANALERHVRPVRFEPGQIEIALTPDADPGLPQRLGQKLQSWTGRRWIVAISREAPATETAREARERNRATVLEQVRADPLVKKLLERFPGAEIVEVRDRAAPAAPAETFGPEPADAIEPEPTSDED